jgi:hypothetical protein
MPRRFQNFTQKQAGDSKALDQDLSTIPGFRPIDLERHVAQSSGCGEEPPRSEGPLADFSALARMLTRADVNYLLSEGISRADVRRFRLQRSRIFIAMLVPYRARVMELYAERSIRGQATPFQSYQDRARLHYSILKMSMAAVNFGLGMEGAGDMVRDAIESVTRTLRIEPNGAVPISA